MSVLLKPVIEKSFEVNTGGLNDAKHHAPLLPQACVHSTCMTKTSKASILLFVALLVATSAVYGSA